MFHPKKIVTILGISTLLLGPLAPTLLPLGAPGAAFAGNGNGGGQGGGKSEGGRASDAGSKGNGGQSAARAKPKAEAEAEAVETVSEEEEEITFARNELGNMNGAMKANINAILAHIRNGNSNGPVGTLASLVAADAKLGDLDAQDVLDRAAAWAAFDAAEKEALGTAYASLADYLTAKEAAAEAEANYQQHLGDWEEAKAAYDQAVEDLANGLITEEELPADPGPAPTAPTPFVEIEAAEALIGTEPTVERPLDTEVLAAEAVTEAEAAVLALWNKNPDSADAMSDEELALLDALRMRFSSQELEQIAAATAP